MSSSTCSWPPRARDQREDRRSRRASYERIETPSHASHRALDDRGPRWSSRAFYARIETLSHASRPARQRLDTLAGARTRRPWGRSQGWAMNPGVIVVGGGHNGLVCAAYLARAGMRPLVIEARATYSSRKRFSRVRAFDLAWSDP